MLLANWQARFIVMKKTPPPNPKNFRWRESNQCHLAKTSPQPPPRITDGTNPKNKQWLCEHNSPSHACCPASPVLWRRGCPAGPILLIPSSIPRSWAQPCRQQQFGLCGISWGQVWRTLQSFSAGSTEAPEQLGPEGVRPQPSGQLG